MLIRPIMAYAPAIWGNASKTNIDKLQKVQNRVLRLITNAPIFATNEIIHRDLKVEYFNDYIIKLTKNFYDSCWHSKYPLIRALGTYVYVEDSQHPWPIKFIK